MAGQSSDSNSHEQCNKAEDTNAKRLLCQSTPDKETSGNKQSPSQLSDSEFWAALPMSPDQTASGQGTYTVMSSLSQPSMRGWWVCCYAGDLNNPRLARWRCSICGHYRCVYCRTFYWAAWRIGPHAWLLCMHWHLTRCFPPMSVALLPGLRSTILIWSCFWFCCWR